MSKMRVAGRRTGHGTGSNSGGGLPPGGGLCNTGCPMSESQAWRRVYRTVWRRQSPPGRRVLCSPRGRVCARSRCSRRAEDLGADEGAPVRRRAARAGSWSSSADAGRASCRCSCGSTRPRRPASLGAKWSAPGIPAPQPLKHAPSGVLASMAVGADGAQSERQPRALPSGCGGRADADGGAAAAGVSVHCARKWVGRYRAEGELGLLNRSSAPETILHRTSE